ncbi:MAG: DJ-1 family protein [Candidatus Omnitrophota bacterium]|jgi:4-methyl-5(b-hydroxyethyl)-thiazole monophosphate biosynthesis|nr:MAG: DJ-1 family protein [Candidatus Omnitrophota bacterium]
MKKKALVLLADGFEEIEAVSCIDILRRADIDVIISSIDGLKVRSSRGMFLLAEERINRLQESFDAYILPGGSRGAKNLAASKTVGKILLKASKENKLIAAICASPAIVLAPLGLLKNKKATCYPGMEELFHADTIHSKDKVVADANIITSQAAATSIPFALEIVSTLKGREKSRGIAKDIVFEDFE